MPFVDVHGCRLYYESVGEGTPMIFVHGGFGGLGTGVRSPAPAWRDRFAQKVRVVTYDRRSSGRSDYPLTPHTMDLLADDVAAVLDELGIERAAVWGTSAGGPIVTTFALRYPQRVAALVVTESATDFFPDPAVRQRLKDRIAILDASGPEAAYEARRTGGTVGLDVFAPDRPIATPEEEEQRKANRARIQADLGGLSKEERMLKYAGELRNYSAYAGFDATARFPSIAAPTLIIQGTNDTVFRGFDWKPLVRGMANAEFTELPGGDHGSVVADAVCLDRILQFVVDHA